MKNLKLTTVILTVGAAHIVAFDSGKAGWKTDKDGNLELSNGNPIWVKDDGSEQSVDSGTIGRLNGEAKSHRERAEAAEASLKKFDGIDPEKAKKDADLISKIDAKTLVDAGEIDKVKDEISKGFTVQLGEKDATIASQGSTIDKMMLDNAFSTSDFVNDKIGVPAEMFRAQFGQNFKVEDGKIIPYGADGNKVYSKTRMGEVANLDEALEIIVDGYAHKDAILKADDGTGSGAGGKGGGRGQGRTMARADFEKLQPAQAAEAAALMGKGELNLT